MAMSRKDYAAIAEALRNCVDHADSTIANAKSRVEKGVALTAANAVADVISRLANELKSGNSAFRYDTFFAACGLDEYGNYVEKSK